MKILGIETSCDETSASVVEDGTNVLSNVIASSQRAFESSGGVIPEEAARKQLESIHPVIEQALSNASLTPDDIDAIAVTRGPGLLVSLLVGTTVARTISSIWKKPLIGVHHTFGHLCSTWLTTDSDNFSEPVFPLLTLTASGGHTDLWYRKSHSEAKLLGRTRDDAAGEAFDKGASLLGLPYPGGPAISKSAMNGNRDTYDFPLPLRSDPSYDFSFSGLKTALRYLVQDLESPENHTEDLAASYEEALCSHLLDKVLKASKDYPDCKELHIVGGVSANRRLRARAAESLDISVRTPEKIEYCTDNAAMIASAGYFQSTFLPSAHDKFETLANTALEELFIGN